MEHCAEEMCLCFYLVIEDVQSDVEVQQDQAVDRSSRLTNIRTLARDCTDGRTDYYMIANRLPTQQRPSSVLT